MESVYLSFFRDVMEPVDAAHKAKRLARGP